MIRSFTILVRYVCLDLKIELELFLKNQVKVFSQFFLQIRVRRGKFATYLPKKDNVKTQNWFKIVHYVKFLKILEVKLFLIIQRNIFLEFLLHIPVEYGVSSMEI